MIAIIDYGAGNIFSEVGSVSVGKRADFVLLDQELNIAAVYIDGKEFTC